MAVGSLTGPQLDQSGFMNVVPNTIAEHQFDPDTMLSNPTLSTSFPASQGWDAGMGLTPGMSGNMDWSQPSQQPAATPTPQTLQSQFMSMGNGETLSGTGMGMCMGDGGVGAENSDEYWNALIDGMSTVSLRVWGGRLMWQEFLERQGRRAMLSDTPDTYTRND